MISTREGLIDALHEAAELEHGLMLQYMFAAMSVKKRLDEGITGAQQEALRDWEGRVLSVMREEMAHLGTVCNLLTSIGGAPRFGRPNFPQAAKTRYPFAFDLLPFGDEALYRFVRFELPKGEKPPSPPVSTGAYLMEAFALELIPEPIEYEYIGELYRKIAEGFANIPEQTLFIGPKFAQDVENWSRRMQILRVVNRESAKAAIDFIVQEGEGSPGKREGSHYATFLSIRKELSSMGRFNPSRPVVPNPRTRPHPDALAPATMITHADSVRVAELFNFCYETVLLMLAQLYCFGGETIGERSALRNGARQMMTMTVRPLAEQLTEMPATDDPLKGNAGPTFELYSPFQLSTQREARFVILSERLRSAADECNALGRIGARFGFISENIALIRQNIEDERAGELRL